MTRGFVCGAFDLLHVGHLHLLRECKKHCDQLTVGLHIDPSKERSSKNKPIQTAMERMVQLRACKYVDSIMVYETEADLLNFLLTDNVDVRFLGSDYEGQLKDNITGADLVPITFIPRKHSYSSSELRQRIKES